MTSYFNDNNGLFLRNPEGGVESVDLMRDAGWDFIALNIGDFPPAQWEQKVIPKAQQAGMAYLPWCYVWNINDLAVLLAVADRWSAGVHIQNHEKQLDDGTVPADQIAEMTGDRDMAISTEAWLYNSVDWSWLTKYPVMLQFFPFENGIWDFYGCEKHARDLGFSCVLFTLGTYDVANGPHSGGKEQPEPGDYETAFRQPLTLYTADDLTYNYPAAYEIWMPSLNQYREPCSIPVLPPLTPEQCPYTGPYYMAGTKYKRVRGKTVKALKIAMDRMGIKAFPKPTTYYGVELGRAMGKWKVSVDLPANPNYGIPSWNALRGSVTEDGEYAFNQEALQLIREDYEAMQNG
jgi:hypothetical protein